MWWFGASSMEDLNRALVAKRGWELMSNKESLWVPALLNKYFRGSNLLQNCDSHGASWFWQGLMQTRDIVGAGFCWSIKSGCDINIWSAPWVPGVEGYTPKLKWGVSVVRRLNHFSDLIDQTSNVWKENLIRDIF